MGNKEKAQQVSDNAKKWSKISFIVFSIVLLLYLMVIAFFILKGFDVDDY